jgi:hypothetical protein
MSAFTTAPENNCNISSNIHDPLAFENYFNRNTVVGSNVNVEESKYVLKNSNVGSHPYKSCSHTYDNPWATEEPFLTSENFLATWVPMPESDGQISKMTEQSRQNAIDQEPLAADLAPQDDDSDAAIGTALKNGKFKCILERCARKTFKRQAELRRHYKTIHAAQKPEFWCNVLSCDRSVAAGGRPFHRKDKLQDHVQRMHERGNDMVQE